MRPLQTEITTASRTVMGDDLPPHKARILLMLLLQNGVQGQKDLQTAFSR